MARITVRLTYLWSFIAFIIGGLIYLSFRSEHLIMFRWAEMLGLSDVIAYLRLYATHFFPMSEWILYSLPDGLWVLSYVLAMSAIWQFELRKHGMIISLIPIIAIVSELMQLVGWVPGVFDWLDLFTYIGSTLIGFLYCIISKSYLYEK